MLPKSFLSFFFFFWPSFRDYCLDREVVNPFQGSRVWNFFDSIRPSFNCMWKVVNGPVMDSISRFYSFFFLFNLDVCATIRWESSKKMQIRLVQVSIIRERWLMVLWWTRYPVSILFFDVSATIRRESSKKTQCIYRKNCFPFPEFRAKYQKFNSWTELTFLSFDSFFQGGVSFKCT